MSSQNACEDSAAPAEIGRLWAKGYMSEEASVRKKRCVAKHHVGDKMVPVTMFGDHPSSRDGLQSFCKPCRNELHKFRRQRDPKFYLTHHIATRVRDQLGAEGYPPGFTKNIDDYLGYRMLDLVRYLNEEVLAREGITLKESIKRGYHLDHKHPLSKFDVKHVNSEEFRACWAMTNLWMISAQANLAKSDRVLSGDELLAAALAKPGPVPLVLPKPAQNSAETAQNVQKPYGLTVDFTPKPTNSTLYIAPKPLTEEIWERAFD